MQLPQSTLLAIVATLFATSQAHMIMNSPVPYGKSTLNSSPVTKADFPCKQREGVYNAEGAQNVMAIGEPQTLAFTGSAVHGGGSCQLSLTKDKAPTADSEWMVIHSIEGNCPARGQQGNFPENPDFKDPDTYQFKIPEGIAPGDYTFAWTWHNRVGNREMYMNCAPVTVTDGKKRRTITEKREIAEIRKRASFPDMFVSNLDASCETTQEEKNIKYPNPGASVEHNADAPNGFVAPQCAVKGGQGSSGGSPPPQSTYGGSTPASTPASGGYTPVASPPSYTMSSPPASVYTPPAATTPASSGGSYYGAGAQKGACTSEGQWNCIGGNQFQRCASGMWTPTQPVAAGMKCTPGQAQNLAFEAS